MIRQYTVTKPVLEGEGWRVAAADMCLDMGITLIGLGLLYWGFLSVYALSLTSEWVLAISDIHNLLSTLADPLMWALWVLYWSTAFGLVRRGWEVRRHAR